jgi:HEPN domain-containing protein
MAKSDSQFDYWRQGADEDMEVARHLVERGNTRHGLFLAHLALEKIIKARICKFSDGPAPRIHNLIRLAEIAQLDLAEDVSNALADMNEYNLEGRYPVPFVSPLTQSEAQQYLASAQEVFGWLTSRL